MSHLLRGAIAGNRWTARVPAGIKTMTAANKNKSSSNMHTFCRSSIIFLIAALILHPVSSFAEIPPLDNASADNGDAPVQVDFELLQEPAPEQPLVMKIELQIEDGYYVYSEPEYSFGFTILEQQGLVDEASLELPETIEIEDLLATDPDATTPVFAEHASIRAEIDSRLVAGDETDWGLRGKFTWQSCTDEICLPPREASVEFGKLPDEGEKTFPATGTITGGWAGRNVVWGALAAFLAGVALSLTPCVYPMIGITVAVIGGNTECSRGRTLWLTFVYVLGLSLVYALAGVAVASLGSQAAEFFRSPYVLTAIGGIFILMALSLFDVFSISMPTSVLGRLQGIGKNGSTGGVLAMGAVSALVVGSCVTGPLISLITFVATTGSVFVGFIYFFALAWGMGVLLFVAGLASGALPRAGAWMQRVKHVLGVVLLWAAFYFARPVVGELVYYAASLTALAAALAFTGLPSFPDKYNSKPRKRHYRQAASFAALLILLAVNTGIVYTIANNPENFKSSDEYQVELAKELGHGQVVLLEFWAPWCAICKEIERDVLNDPEIEAILERENIRVVKVHYDHNQQLNRKFEVIGPPAFVFLDPDGTRLSPMLVAKQDIRQAIENRIWQ